MIAVLALLAAVASTPTTPAPASATKPTYDAVVEPNWLSIPNKTMMSNCTNGYLTDPKFPGEAIVMACLVRPDGGLSDCQVRETKQAEAAGVQEVAICAAAGFRIGPLDKFGKPTAGRPMILPLAIVSGANAGPPAPAAATAPHTP